jgi:hypothetical protein
VRLKEHLYNVSPVTIPISAVWGFGHPLWEESLRQYAHRPLKVCVCIGATAIALTPPHASWGDAQVANRNDRDFGREIARRFAHTRRFPSSKLQPVLACTRTTRKFWRCPSFKDHFLSPRAEP